MAPSRRDGNKIGPGWDIRLANGIVSPADDRPIQPEETVLEGVEDTFEYTFPGHSVTFLRVPTV